MGVWSKVLQCVEAACCSGCWQGADWDVTVVGALVGALKKQTMSRVQRRQCQGRVQHAAEAGPPRGCSRRELLAPPPARLSALQRASASCRVSMQGGGSGLARLFVHTAACLGQEVCLPAADFSALWCDLAAVRSARAPLQISPRHATQPACPEQSRGGPRPGLNAVWPPPCVTTRTLQS